MSNGLEYLFLGYVHPFDFLGRAVCVAVRRIDGVKQLLDSWHEITPYLP
jgi:hypothetical protein